MMTTLQEITATRKPGYKTPEKPARSLYDRGTTAERKSARHLAQQMVKAMMKALLPPETTESGETKYDDRMAVELTPTGKDSAIRELSFTGHSTTPVSTTAPHGWTTTEAMLRPPSAAVPLWHMANRDDRSPINFGYRPGDGFVVHIHKARTEAQLDALMSEFRKSFWPKAAFKAVMQANAARREKIAEGLEPETPHRDIMTPSSNNEVGIFAIADHLGEGQRVVERFVETPGPAFGMSRGQLLLPRTDGLTMLEAIIYNEAGLTAQGDPVLPHENRKPRAWHTNAGGIKAKFGCSAEDATKLDAAFKAIEIGPIVSKMSGWFDKMIASPEGFAAGLAYFTALGNELTAVTFEEDNALMVDYIDETEEEDVAPIGPDNPAPLSTVDPTEWHKLDDYRDNVPRWETRQPKEFQAALASVRSAKTFTDLKAVGKSLYGRAFTRTQGSVIWGEYAARKHALSPKLGSIALAALRRLADPSADLKAAKAWLAGEGRKALNVHEHKVVTASWWAVVKSKAPKQQALPLDEKAAKDKLDAETSAWWDSHPDVIAEQNRLSDAEHEALMAWQELPYEINRKAAEAEYYHRRSEILSKRR